jgi:hypothetical protein
MSVVINGSAGVTTNSGAVYDSLQRDTAKASTSGTSIDFTGIPSWVRRVTVMLNGVSTNGTSSPMLQIGDGSVNATGYLCIGTTINASPGATAYTTGFTIRSGSAAAVILGSFVLTNINSNNWVCSAVFGDTGGTAGFTVGGSKSLSGVLDRVRITTVNGTDTFDAGTINILYE